MYLRCRSHLVHAWVAVTTVVILLPAASWACSVCWGGNAALARGLNTNIVFLMSMPFLVTGSLIGVLYIAQKRARGPRGSASSRHHLVLPRKDHQP